MITYRQPVEVHLQHRVNLVLRKGRPERPLSVVESHHLAAIPAILAIKHE